MLGLLTLDWPRLARWQGPADGFAEEDYRALERSGIRIFHPAVETSTHDPHRAALQWIAGWSALTGRDACFLAPVRSTAELDSVAAAGRIGIIVGFQNADHFRGVSDVGAFFQLGQRVSQLTYNDDNRIGSGCHSPRDGGLTDFGAAIVREMDRVGMAIDVSHCGERTGLETIAHARRPVLVTHSNCAALVPGQRRCKSDKLIRAMAAGGGVMGITAVRPFVGGGAATIDKLLDHFDHVRRIAGAEHVGLGSDVDVAPHATRTPAARALYTIIGLDPVARVFQIADGLLARGWSRDQVALVLGGNFRRALAAIWPPTAAPDAIARDPFCPAPDRRAPGGVAARG
jgi:membrane dipeptidase